MRAHGWSCRVTVLGAAAALTTACLPLLAGGPAAAASGPLTYHCTAGGDASTYDLAAVVDTNAPASLLVHQSVALVATTAVTLPDAITASLRAAGATTVSGTSQTAEIVNGSTRAIAQTIPGTSVPASGALQVVGSGPGGTIRGVTAGTPVVIGAGNLTVALTGYDGAGTVKLSAFLGCQLSPAGQSAVVDTVSVLPIPTTTSLAVRKSRIEFGTSTKLVVKVAKAGTTAKLSVPVDKGRAVIPLPAATKMGTNVVTGVFTPTDKNVAPSQGTTSYSVVRGHTTTTTLITLRDTRHKLVGTSLVTSVNGTDVSGRVRFTLFRNDAKIRTRTVALTRKDRARAVFQRIRRPGSYLLKTKYLGSPTLKRSKTQTRLRINDPNAL